MIPWSVCRWLRLWRVVLVWRAGSVHEWVFAGDGRMPAAATNWIAAAGPIFFGCDVARARAPMTMSSCGRYRWRWNGWPRGGAAVGPGGLPGRGVRMKLGYLSLCTRGSDNPGFICRLCCSRKVLPAPPPGRPAPPPPHARVAPFGGRGGRPVLAKVEWFGRLAGRWRREA